MRKVGVAACPADAIPEILQVSQYIAHAAGGKGCVREVIEKTLRIQQRWPADHLLEKPAES
jgi:3-deoxy-D-manno-octulosonate 8-phosphate phosphatase (KDO 8-P phosphatase)